jgi:hypothetical protein
MVAVGDEVWVVRERLVGLLWKAQAGGRGKERRRELLIFPLQHCLKREGNNYNKHACMWPSMRRQHR